MTDTNPSHNHPPPPQFGAPPHAPGMHPPQSQASIPGVPVPPGHATSPGAAPHAASQVGFGGGWGNQGAYGAGGLDPNEVETPEQALEVSILWGDSVLHVSHLNPPRDFFVGESEGKESPVDFLMGVEALGVSRLPVVLAEGAPSVVIPEGATGTLWVDGQNVPVEVMRGGGRLQPCPGAPGATQFPLAKGGMARIEHRGFSFIVKDVNAGKPIGAGYQPEKRPFIYWAGSLAVHLMFLLMFYFLPPRPASLSLDLLNTDSKLIKYVMDPEELEEEKLETSDQADDAGGKGKRHAGDEGQMGKKESKKTKNRFGIKGPQDNPDPHMAREQAKEQAANAGIIGVLKASTGAWDSPTSPFGRDTALGNDAMSALGAMMGDNVGENFGFGGLGLRGTGRGGGGDGTGTIGMGNMNTIGHGGGGGSGSGYGRGKGGLGGRKSKVPTIRSGVAAVRGSLSKEVIRRVVRRHINEVKFCYEQELNSRPDLEGRVTVAFIISPTGAVQSSNVASSTMGNRKVEQCVASKVRTWTFPSPDGGGIVSVNYPFMLSPSGG